MVSPPIHYQIKSQVENDFSEIFRNFQIFFGIKTDTRINLRINNQVRLLGIGLEIIHKQLSSLQNNLEKYFKARNYFSEF